MAYSSYLEGLASKAYSESAANELATVPPYGTDREVFTFLYLGSLLVICLSVLCLCTIVHELY
jgi:hypothetical protein